MERRRIARSLSYGCTAGISSGPDIVGETEADTCAGCGFLPIFELVEAAIFSSQMGGTSDCTDGVRGSSKRKNLATESVHVWCRQAAASAAASHSKKFGKCAVPLSAGHEERRNQQM